jgi:hypothetical protein
MRPLLVVYGGVWFGGGLLITSRLHQGAVLSSFVAGRA